MADINLSFCSIFEMIKIPTDASRRQIALFEKNKTKKPVRTPSPDHGRSIGTDYQGEFFFCLLY